jgi:hypothetical protein
VWDRIAKGILLRVGLRFDRLCEDLLRIGAFK